MTQSFAWSPATASARLDASLKRIETDPLCDAVFIKTLDDRAKGQAEAAPKMDHPLSGALVSVKALFDLEGEVSTAASPILAENQPAEADAPCIANLAKAGVVFVGISNEPQFSYSGLGQNPHYGTPGNALNPEKLPGGSTSGGGVSVGLDLCDIAIGSDTGGSIRIPAAFNGVVGFKPTQETVSTEGGVTLSESLDSFGPLARSVAACELVWQVMAGREVSPVAPQVPTLRLAKNIGFTDLQPEVGQGFEALLKLLANENVDIHEEDLQSTDCLEHLQNWMITSVEARSLYEDLYQSRAADIDPYVFARLARADELTSVEYQQARNLRAAFVKAFKAELGEEFLILPTSPILPPDRSVLDDADMFNMTNLRASSHTSMGNLADACALALPYRFGGEVLSLMVVGPKRQDERLLACGKALEPLLAKLS